MSYIKNIFFVFLLTLPSVILPQSEHVDLNMVHRIRQEGLKNSQIRDLSFHLVDVIGSRLSGSTGLTNANIWTSQQLTEWGLSNILVEPWGEFGRGWENERFYIAMKEPYYQHLIAMPRAWTRGTDGPVVTNAVLVNITKYDDFKNYEGKLRNKVVVTPVVSEPEFHPRPRGPRLDYEALEELARYPEIIPPPYGKLKRQQSEANLQRDLAQKTMQFFEDEGVLALFSPSGTFGLVRSHGRGYNVNVDEGLSQVDMTFEHYGRIVRLLEAGVDVEIELDIQNRFLYDDLNGYNVIAEIPGIDPNLTDEVVMIGAHLDSWHGGGGATDNGSGVVVMMEVMRILMELDVKPRRTIRIALWGSEEQGIHGSRNYVRNHFFDPDDGGRKPAYEKLSAYYNIDNGSARIQGIYLEDNDALRPIFETWFEPLQDLGVSTVTLRKTPSTDHVPFDNVGLPGFQFIQDWGECGGGAHTNLDTFERMNLGGMMLSATIVAVLVYHTAMRDEMLPRKYFNK